MKIKINNVRTIPYSYLGEQQNPHELTLDKDWIQEIRFPYKRWMSGGIQALANPEYNIAMFFVVGAGSKKELGIRAGCYCFLAQDKLYKRITYSDVITAQFIVKKKKNKPGYSRRRVKPAKGLRLVRNNNIIFFIKEIQIPQGKLEELQGLIELGDIE